MDLQLNGKRALVSGSTAGIGYAIAEALAREGAAVVINGRTQKRVDDALRQLNGNVVGIAADLGTAAGVEETIARFPFSCKSISVEMRIAREMIRV